MDCHPQVFLRLLLDGEEMKDMGVHPFHIPQQDTELCGLHWRIDRQYRRFMGVKVV